MYKLKNICNFKNIIINNNHQKIIHKIKNFKMKILKKRNNIFKINYKLIKKMKI